MYPARPSACYIIQLNKRNESPIYRNFPTQDQCIYQYKVSHFSTDLKYVFIQLQLTAYLHEDLILSFL